VVTALEKNRLVHVWRAVHILNYLIFLAIFIKAMIIGTDVSAAAATAELMKSVMILYVVLAAAATTLRVIDRRKIAARRRRAAETAP
jgi:DMSO/TMAO reductase YedYZ heme-binding membrane subunit